MDERGGYVADAYLRSIQRTAQQHNADPGVLLGFVIAHEFGHLLLGPGHSQDGIMRALWGKEEITQTMQRGVKFNREQSAAIARSVRQSE